MTTNANFKKLQALSKEQTVLTTIYQLLEWDQETMMPEKGMDLRAHQLELLAPLIHKRKTSSEFAKILGSLIDLKSGRILDTSLSTQFQSALREWRKDYLRAVKIPAPFVKKMAKTTALSLSVWAKSKATKNFALFAPHLERIVEMSKKKAEFLGYDKHPYDALLDLYEPEMRVAFLDPLFDQLKTKIGSLVSHIASRPKAKEDFLFGTFATDKQMEFNHKILNSFGFTKGDSRLDLSNHPFCLGLHPQETRMTTHIHPTSLMSSIFGVIHEAGHGLYNQGLNYEYYGTPLCDQISLGIDESQSRWWETLVGHSMPFWHHFFPMLQSYFPEKLQSVSLKDFYQAINNAEPSLIRIEADEVTYSLHIIVRFELEKALIEGSLKVKDLQEAWNEKMQRYFGITPKDASEGCLQDIHWAMGSFGYFPTYTLGNLYAAQFFAEFAKQHPDWEKRVSRGEFDFMTEWLRINIHHHGRELTSQQLCEKVTKKPLSEEAYINYLENKYRIL